MPMFNTACIIVLSALMYANGASNAVESASTSSKQWIIANYEKYKPNVIAIGNRVFHVGIRENTVNITSVDGSSINVCNFNLPPNRIVDPNVVRPLVLGNGKIVVRTLMSQQATAYQSPSESSFWDLFIVVDPLDCSSIKTVELLNKGWRRDVATVLPYRDSFDVFYRESSDANDLVFKTPRRFNDKAEPIDLDHHLGLESDISGFHIESIKPFEASEGYVCTLVSRTDRTMSLRRLDSRFQVVKEVEIEPSANVMSVAADSVNLCYVNTDGAAICSVYDLDALSRRNTVWLNESKNYKDDSLKLEVVKVARLPSGDSIAAIAYKRPDMSEDKGQTTEYYAQRINSDGSAAKAVYIGNYTSFFDLMSVISLGGDEICLTIVAEIEARFGFKKPRNTVVSKCFIMLK